MTINLASGPADITEQPRFFDSVDQQLYGVFHPAAHRRPGAPVVVFCNSFGPDHVVAWRMEVLAARMAAARGYCAFSFHPRAHGDSTGNFAHLTFESLVEDALAAAHHAREAADTSLIVWVGIGFGALVTAEVIRREASASALALWEPVHRGRDYFRGQLRRALFREIAQGRRPKATVDQLLERLERDGELFLYGERVYPALFRTFYRSAVNLDLARSLEGWHRPAFLAQVQRQARLSPDGAALAAALERRGAKVAVACLADEPIWNGFDPPWISDSLLRQTAEWLDGLE